MSLAITPETKIGELLDAYPALEQVLIDLAPPFEKLKNPILRRTVAKVATLEQAAKIGGVGLRPLLAKLREAAGQDDPAGAAGEVDAPEDPTAPPEWLSENVIRHTIDADSLLESGAHPIGRIRQLLATMQPGEIIRLNSSFRPEPLIEAMTNSGLGVHSVTEAPGRHTTYIMHPSQP